MRSVDTSHEQTIQIIVHRSTVLSDVIKQFKEKRKTLDDPNLRMIFQVVDMMLLRRFGESFMMHSQMVRKSEFQQYAMVIMQKSGMLLLCLS